MKRLTFDQLIYFNRNKTKCSDGGGILNAMLSLKNYPNSLQLYKG